MHVVLLRLVLTLMCDAFRKGVHSVRSPSNARLMNTREERERKRKEEVKQKKMNMTHFCKIDMSVNLNKYEDT